MSLDMVTFGNVYDDSTNTMTASSVDNCLVTDPGNNAQHNHTTHLIIQDVEDLVGWQARMNYDGGRMRPSTVNFAPFLDNTTGQNVSFVNLPLDGGVHRDLATATNIPPQAATFQTALVGASYMGVQSFAVSPDTPAKTPPDDASYSAPSGGVLVSINLQVLAGQIGQPSLYVDLDDADPNPPGSDAVAFTGTGTAPLSLGEADLGDGFHSEGVPCVPVAPPAVVLPPQSQPPGGPASPDSPSADTDNDGFSDLVESSAGTDTLRPCGVDAWPADINNDRFVDIIGDMSTVGAYAFQRVPPAPARYDIAPDPPDGTIGVITDLNRMAGVFGTGCVSPHGGLVRSCGPEGAFRSNWHAAVTSGSGSTVKGTMLWTYTPFEWSVDAYGTWAQSAWLIDDSDGDGKPTGNGRDLEVGFFSGRWPANYEVDPFGFYVQLVPYYTISNGAEGWLAPVKENPSYQVPRSSWAQYYVISSNTGASVATVVPGYTFDFHYQVLVPRINYAQGEVAYHLGLTNNPRTWMGGGSGEPFWGYWTDSISATSSSGWYAWGSNPFDHCRNEPYWIHRYDANVWENGGYNPP